jgi:hypothetical protein
VAALHRIRWQQSSEYASVKYQTRVNPEKGITLTPLFAMGRFLGEIGKMGVSGNKCGNFCISQDKLPSSFGYPA